MYHIINMMIEMICEDLAKVSVLVRPGVYWSVH
jgi:hypothetical protein